MAKNWELAGYSDLQGRLGKRIPPSHIIVPGSIWPDGDFLRWELCPDRNQAPQSLNPSKTLLNEFVRLHAAPEKILGFAQKNGVLWQDGIDAEGREPINEWRRLSRKTCALLNIGVDLAARRRKVNVEEWKWVRLYEAGELADLTSPAASFVEMELEISRAWLDECGFSMRRNKQTRTFGLEIDYRGKMLNAVGLQLAVTLADLDSIFICSGCQYPYGRPKTKRRPRKGQANFCDECGTKAALRQADERRKAKIAEARRLYSAGISIERIAEQIDTEITCVKRWVG
jgi:hypothetical protein